MIHWSLTIDFNVAEPIDFNYVKYFINKTLLDENGWRKKGYYFNYLCRCCTSVRSEDPIFHIRISTPETISTTCKLPSNLSCADMNKNVIYLNSKRWVYGSVESGMNLEDYRTYLVNHEIGHLLKRSHNPCSNNIGDSCPVMYQQTISKGCCKPNKYPLDWE